MRGLFVILCFFLYEFSYGQVAPPPYIREANVMISKRIWRVIDLREKQNKPATWPGNPITKILYQSVMDGSLIPFKNDSLKSVIDYELFVKLGADIDYVHTPIDANDPEITRLDTIITNFEPTDKIDQLLLLEDWIFDKQHGVERAYIIAIAPLYNKKVAGVDLGLQPLCWLKYYDKNRAGTDLRTVLYKQKIFNKQNDRRHLTFGDWFEQRLFSSYIIKESNMHDLSVMDDPEVKKEGLKALLSAERIKLLNADRESDQFEY